jgi:alpha-ribazole phosphatase
MTRGLWIARHAPASVRGICYGRSDVPVVGSPDEHAFALASTFPETPPPELVWTSPAARCRDVATRLAARWGIEARIDERLHELDFGAWEGRAWADVETDDREVYQAWMREWRTRAPPSGERPCDLEARARAWLTSLDAHRAHALIAHAGVVRALRVVVHGIDWLAAMHEEIAHLEWRCLGEITMVSGT